MDNTILIEGHTDSRPIKGRNGYSNWELSGDRANAARRFMQDAGLRPDQVKQVRGFADQALMKKEDPGAANNRRVSIIVQYNKPKPKPADTDKEKAGKKEAHGKEDQPAEHGAKADAKEPAHAPVTKAPAKEAPPKEAPVKEAAAKPSAHEPEPTMNAGNAAMPELNPERPKKKRRKKKAD
jgi:chemotaxis protein MotB